MALGSALVQLTDRAQKVIDMLRFFILVAFLSVTMIDGTSAGDAATSSRPLVGAIRWDAWHGDRGMPGRAVEKSLGPKAWRYRLPFFARVLSDGKVELHGDTQDVMDREIEYASASGIDYWAFLTYDAQDPMSRGLHLYLSSPRKEKVRFCFILHQVDLKDRKAEVTRLTALLNEPTYQKVLDGRPLVFSFQCAAGRSFYDDLRKAATAAGLKAPYFVYQGGSANDLERLGLDALGDYAVAGSGQGAPYATLVAEAEGRWEKHRAGGSQVVPLVTAGWDRRPRMVNPGPWEAWQKPGEGLDRFYKTPTPDELAAHLERSLKWIEGHPEAAPAKTVLIYAWNEFDEGGWICPTLEHGSDRLDAIGKVPRTNVLRSR